jgi:hypothetical protein
LDLTPEQVEAASLVGVEFPHASAEQIRRLSMQRKVFHIDGQPALATRNGAFFETVGTLTALIAEGEQRRRDLDTWAATAPGAEDKADVAALSPTAEEISAPSLSPEAATKDRPGPFITPEEQSSGFDGPAGVAEAPLLLTRDITRESAAALPRVAQATAKRGERWLTAGAGRRGRTNQHWSQHRRG